ncbi:thiamine pyrophosphate-dependent enzyme, partial [Escherichia coli]|uniref:thiamine pyrophosphate-dependent enzyme n=1 Tax=Escherichia coli TaxID=562 RepID=UPI001F3A2EAC
MLESPILHVNGDDTEAVIFALSLSFAYRQKFKKPVIVDMYCYRRLGHNEGDEPFFTQPIMYKAIKSHNKITQIYSEKLINSKIIDKEYVDKAKANWREYLEVEF